MRLISDYTIYNIKRLFHERSKNSKQSVEVAQCDGDLAQEAIGAINVIIFALSLF